jgi:hypothetical protein
MCPQAVLEQLSQDIDTAPGVAKNRSCPPELLERMVHSSTLPACYRKLYLNAAGNRNCSPGTLGRLAQLHDNKVDWKIANNPACPPSLLATLSRARYYDVQTAVLANPGCSPEALDILSQDRRSRVRRYVAAHPACSPATLERLFQDRAGKVRQAVCGRLLPERHDCPPSDVARGCEYVRDRIRRSAGPVSVVDIYHDIAVAPDGLSAGYSWDVISAALNYMICHSQAVRYTNNIIMLSVPGSRPSRLGSLRGLLSGTQ